MQRTCVINVAGLGPAEASEMGVYRSLASSGVALGLEPVLPATTCPVQATFMTGEPPARHGIVANGLYLADTAEVRFWEQSAHLASAPRVWSLAPDRPRVAVLFWQLSMYGDADVLLTPKPVHAPGGRLISTCYARPADLYDRLAADLGPFDLMSYWGPRAGVASSKWIAGAARRVWRDEAPDLMLVYLPHLDYSGHRFGPDDDRHRREARALDDLVGAIADDVAADGGRVMLLSEYSFLPVTRAVAPNRALREAGMLALRTVDGGEYLYPGDSEAFALVDNQVAHVYFPAAADLDASIRRARRALGAIEGVSEVLARPDLAERGLDHIRAGDLVLLAEPDAHFTYYWWLDEAAAPPFARTVDIHAKPGFDAAELFVDESKRAIPVTAERVRGSHGLVLEDGRGWGVYADSHPPASLAGRRSVRATEVAHLMVPQA